VCVCVQRRRQRKNGKFITRSEVIFLSVEAVELRTYVDELLLHTRVRRKVHRVKVRNVSELQRQQ
jgi:hypothetical protein